MRFNYCFISVQNLKFRELLPTLDGPIGVNVSVDVSVIYEFSGGWSKSESHTFCFMAQFVLKNRFFVILRMKYEILWLLPQRRTGMSPNLNSCQHFWSPTWFGRDVLWRHCWSNTSRFREFDCRLSSIWLVLALGMLCRRSVFRHFHLPRCWSTLCDAWKSVDLDAKKKNYLFHFRF